MLRNSSILTQRQVATVQAIRAIQSRDGIPPSLEDIAAEMEIKKATAQYLVNQLVRKAMLTRTPGKIRSMRLTAAASTVPEAKKKGKAA